MFWFVWFVLLIILFVLPFGWGYPRYGVPRPYYQRRADVAADRAGWGAWGVLLWLVLMALVIWAVVVIVA
ncbi:MAG: hypothetical protein IT304_10665 [Dehalococcoidia bacterium]|nr:hypothetical protein [Dehalococcoidia bacterium]